jgi:photosystem II stability/assembly factor-like uncharacterized protein
MRKKSFSVPLSFFFLMLAVAVFYSTKTVTTNKQHIQKPATEIHGMKDSETNTIPIPDNSKAKASGKGKNFNEPVSTTSYPIAFAHSKQCESGDEKGEVNNEVVDDEESEEESLDIETKHRQSVWFALSQAENPDYFEVKKLFDSYFSKHRNEKSKSKEVCATWLKTQLFYLDRNNKVVSPPLTNYNALSAVAPQEWSTVTDTMAGDWRMLGPRNTYQTNYSGIGNKGGYVSCARIDPVNPNKLFIGFTTGGLWVSADGGKVWQLTDKNLPDREYIDIDICKANNSFIYAINNGSSAAVIKSMDGGLSWAPTSLNSTNYPGAKAYDIAVSPSDPNVIIARWGATIYRTTDGGNTWTNVLTGLQDYSVWGGTNINAETMDFHATDANVVYHLDRSDISKSVTVYRSADAGATFGILGNFSIPTGANGTVIGWSKILKAASNPGVIYIAMGTGGSAYGHNDVQLIKLDATSGAVLQTKVNIAKVHHGDITMDTENENLIVYGSYAEGKAHYSVDNGTSFTTSSSLMHSDLRSFSMVNGKVLMGNDGEGAYSADGGATFTSLTAAVSNHELWGFGAAYKSDVLGAGTNHGPLMIRQHEGPQGWYNAMGADQGNSDVNPLDDQYLYSQGYNTYHVKRTGPHTMTSGAGAQEIDPGGIYSYFNTMHFHPNLYYTFITHHAGQFPTGNPNLAAWKNSLIRSDNNGVTINKIIKTFSSQVFREDICMTNPNAIYVVEGLSNNKLWKTTDGGSTWTEITPSVNVTGVSVRNISDIAVSDVNPNEIWVSYSGVQNTCQVLHSTDGGATYTNLTTSTLTSFPITKIIFQRGSNGGVYVGNKSGVFYRNNSMSNWKKLGFGLPMVDVRFMFINYLKGKLMIGTSRGAWEHDLHEPSSTKAQISADRDTVKCSREPVQFRDYSVARSGPSVSYSWSFPGGMPAASSLENPLVHYSTQGNYNVTLTVTDQYGTSTQTLENFIKVLPSECTGIDSLTGKSLHLSSTTDKGSIESLPLNTNAFTVTAWVKPSAIQSDFTGIIIHSSRTGLFVKNGTNELGYMWADKQWWWNSGLTLPPNQWSHLAWVVTPAYTALFVNGKAAINNTPNTLIDLSKSAWIVGEDGGSNRNFNGEIDELCVYNRPLSQDEVREKMHLTRSTLDSGLVGYYQFNESSSSVFYNKVEGGSNMSNVSGGHVVSTAPVASGVAVRKSITAQGHYDFETADAIISLTNNTAGTSIYPGGDVIVYKLESQPNEPPAINSGNRYWIIRNFGVNDSINTLHSLTFRQTGFYTSGNSLNKRRANDFGSTWGDSISVSTGTSSSANGGTQEFTGLQTTVARLGQFAIGNNCIMPVGLQATEITDHSVNLSWQPVANALSYGVDYKTVASASWQNATSNTLATSLQLSNLLEATDYEWQVRANYLLGNSCYALDSFRTEKNCQSEDDKISNDGFSTAVPVALDSDVKGKIRPKGDQDYYSFNLSVPGLIKITVDNLPEDYDLELYNASQVKVADSYNRGIQNETIGYLAAPGRYYIKVFGYNGTVFNPKECYTLKVATGLQNLVNSAQSPSRAEVMEATTAKSTNSTVYPNPVGDVLNINSVGFKGKTDVNIYDIHGRLVLQQVLQNGTTTLVVTNLTKGIYVVKLTTRDKKSVIKVIKK